MKGILFAKKSGFCYNHIMVKLGKNQQKILIFSGLTVVVLLFGYFVVSALEWARIGKNQAVGVNYSAQVAKTLKQDKLSRTEISQLAKEELAEDLCAPNFLVQWQADAFGLAKDCQKELQKAVSLRAEIAKIANYLDQDAKTAQIVKVFTEGLAQIEAENYEQRLEAWRSLGVKLKAEKGELPKQLAEKTDLVVAALEELNAKNKAENRTEFDTTKEKMVNATKEVVEFRQKYNGLSDILVENKAQVLAKIAKLESLNAELVKISPEIAAPKWYQAQIEAAKAVVVAPPRTNVVTGARVVYYTVSARGNVRSSLAEFAQLANATLNDGRGWAKLGIRFEQVQSGGSFNLILSEAQLLPTFSSGCSAEYSCRVGVNVIINDDRWSGASASWNGAGGGLNEYRQMVVNHEVGHWLGLVTEVVKQLVR